MNGQPVHCDAFKSSTISPSKLQTRKLSVSVAAAITEDSFEILENAEDKIDNDILSCSVTAVAGQYFTYRKSSSGILFINDNGKEIAYFPAKGKNYWEAEAVDGDIKMHTTISFRKNRIVTTMICSLNY